MSLRRAPTTGRTRTRVCMRSANVDHAATARYFEGLHDLARTVAMLDPEEARALLAAQPKVS